MINNSLPGSLTKTSPETSGFFGVEETRFKIANALKQKREFRDADMADLDKCAFSALISFRTSLSIEIHRQMKQANVLDEDIQKALEIVCSSPVRTRPHRQVDFGIAMHIPPEAIRITHTPEGIQGKKSQGGEYFHYEFNPGLIVPTITRVDTVQPIKPLSNDNIKTVVAEGKLSQLVQEKGFEYVLGAMRRMLVSVAKKREMTQADRTEISGMLDVLVQVSKEDTASGAAVQEEHLRRIETVRSMMSGQEVQTR